MHYTQSFNRYAYVGNSPCNFTDQSGLAQCTLNVGITFPAWVGSGFQTSVETTLQNLFGPDVGLQFSVGGVGEVNINIGAALTSLGEVGNDVTGGFVLSLDNIPMNWGFVDFGVLMTTQYGLGGPQGQTARLAAAIGRVAAHELGHELFLLDNPLGGVMGSPMNPFTPLQFSSNEKINILNRCLYLQRLHGGGGGGGWSSWFPFDSWYLASTTVWSEEYGPEEIFFLLPTRPVHPPLQY